MEDDIPSGSPSPKKMKSHARHEHEVTSGGGALETEFGEDSILSTPKMPTRVVSEASSPVAKSKKRDPIEVPKDPLEDFVVPPAGIPYGEASLNSSGSFPWIADLSPMMDEI